MPLATAEGITAGELQRIGVKDVTEADKDEVVFGASVPTPPWAKVIKRTVDPNQNNAESFDYYTTFYDPSKANQIEASGGDFDWTHTKNGRYNPR
jgi:hypothetical protein